MTEQKSVNGVYQNMKRLHVFLFALLFAGCAPPATGKAEARQLESPPKIKDERALKLVKFREKQNWIEEKESSLEKAVVAFGESSKQ